MAVLSGLLPVEQGVACLAALRKHADSLIATGDTDGRTRDQLVADTREGERADRASPPPRPDTTTRAAPAPDGWPGAQGEERAVVPQRGVDGARPR
jgi:hypothetical protein